MKEAHEINRRQEIQEAHEITEAKVPGNNKRRAEGDGESSQDVAAGKRSRPAARGDVAARGHGAEAETAESADDVMSLTMKDIDEIPVELRVAVLRSRALQMEEEVKRLRCLIQARSGEFAEERKQLVGKLMASEQARRECEAALETNDTMWQQLVQNQMAALQQKIAAQSQQQQQQQQTGDGGSQTAEANSELVNGKDKSQQGAKASSAAPVANGLDPQPLSSKDNLVEEDSQDFKQRNGATPQGTMSAADTDYTEIECTVVAGDAGDAQGTILETSEEEANAGEDEQRWPPEVQPMSPASNLVAKWASKRRRTLGGGGGGDSS
jgi:hypothetical protein